MPITKTPLSLSIAAIALLITCGCGDLMNEPEESPKQEPTIEQPKPKENNAPKTQDVEKMCDEERQWVFAKGFIDADQLRLYRRRRLGPVYNQAGVRQSGIEAWFECEAALKMNGFIK